MVNYYETLKVSPKASSAEIKSAYRRLARKLHPDKNNGSEATARAFAAIAEAYEILGNVRERELYDKRALETSFNGIASGDSIFASKNVHAKRWRQMVYEHRYNEIIDRMIAEERRESLALQRIIFPTVALFASTLVVGIFKPEFFVNSGFIGRLIVVTLFSVGVIHLVGRFREALERYAYFDDEMHESILDSDEPAATRRFSRVSATAFITIGIFAFFGLGLLIGNYVSVLWVPHPSSIMRMINPEGFFYPPIFVMCVDFVHGFMLRGDN